MHTICKVIFRYFSVVSKSTTTGIADQTLTGLAYNRWPHIVWWAYYIRYIKSDLKVDILPSKSKLWELFNTFLSTKVNCPRYQYLVHMQRQMEAIKLFRIGQRINQSSLRKAGKEEFSKSYFANCNPTYCTINSALTYQDKWRTIYCTGAGVMAPVSTLWHRCQVRHWGKKLALAITMAPVPI